MIVISTREFRAKQKVYLDLIDNNEQVIVQRGRNKAYSLVPITETDKYFNSEVLKRLDESIKQIEDGKVITIESKDEIKNLLGL
ncbi:MAG: prevent-host-death protein [Bacteroidota bacterium]